MDEILNAMKGQVIVDAQPLDCFGEPSEVCADCGLLLTLGNGKVFSLMARMWSCDDCELLIEEVEDG